MIVWMRLEGLVRYGSTRDTESEKESSILGLRSTGTLVL
jgi:hypothetical protein